MDLKEPSVHASQRSRSQTNRSQANVQQTIDSVATRVTIDPEGQVMKRTTAPLLLNYLISELVNIFVVFILWHYSSATAVSQLSVAFPICYFVSQAIPRAISQAQVAYITKAIAESKVKQADECLAYHFVLQGAYFILSLFFAFFLSISFSGQAKLSDTDVNYASVYIPLNCTLGTLLSIFNNSTEALLLIECKNTFNMVRSVATSLLQLLFILMAYQFSAAQKEETSLTQMAIGQILGQLVPAIVMVVYYQDFKPSSIQGVLKAKFKYLKSFQMKQLGQVLLLSLPKISQFGSQSLLVFCCNIVVSQTFTEASDIMVARVGLLYYFLSFNLFGFVMFTYIYSSEAELGLNLLQKKYIRSKELLLKGLIWALVLQGIILILALVIGTSIVQFFMPDSQAADKSFFVLYGSNYITYSFYLPIIMIPYHYCQAVYAIEANWKMNILLNLVHPIIGILTLLTTQFTVGDRADLFWVEFYADLFAGISGTILLIRKIFEVMQLAKIELKRLKKKKKLEEEGRAEELEKQD